MDSSEGVQVLSSDTEDGGTSVNGGASTVMGNNPLYSSLEDDILMFKPKESSGIFRHFFPKVTDTLPEFSTPSNDASSSLGK